MAAKYEGIIIEFGGDVTPLNKALKDVDQTSKGLQAELRQVNNLLKLDPKNTELLAQKQKLLAEAVSSTRGKLDTLREAERQAQAQFKDGKISEEQYRGLQREIVSTEQSLKKLEAQAKESNKTVSSIAEATKKLGDSATNLGKKMAPVSAAAAGVVGGMVAMAVKAGQSADEINTLAKQTGLSTEQIQKFQYATEVIDVPLETLTGSMAKLTKNMATAQKGTGDAAKAFKTLKVNIVDGHGALRSNQDVFDETIKKLGEMENGTQRDALAMQIFGKSAQDLNPLILGGAESLKQLGDEAQKAGLILSQEALDAANEFNDEIDVLKAQSAGTFAALGTEIGAALLPMLKDLAAWFKEVLSWVQSMDKDTLAFIATIAGVVAALAPLLMIIGSVSKGISALGGAMNLLAANPIVLIVAAIAALVLAFVHLWNTSEGFRNFFIKMGEDISKAFAAVGDFFVNLFVKVIPDALTEMKKFFTDVFEGLVNIAKAPINLIIGLINGAIGGINLLIKGINSIKFTLPDWIPEWLGGGQTIGFNVPEIPQIPMLAKGGVLSEGAAIIAEAGPEMLRVKNGKAIVTPLTAGAKTTPATPTGNTYNINVQNIDQLNTLLKWFDGRRQSERAIGNGVM